MNPGSPEVCPRCGYRLAHQDAASWTGKDPAEGERPATEDPLTARGAPDAQVPKVPQTFDALIETMRQREVGLGDENGESDSGERKSWRSSARGEDRT